MKIIPEPTYISVNTERQNLYNHIALGNNSLSNYAIEDFLSFCNKPKGEANIIFHNDDSLAYEEYRLTVDNAVSVFSSSASGQLYALETLKQIFTQFQYNVPVIEIKDKPKYKIRGLMIDVGRYFYCVDDIKSFIRKMALHKLNFLHMHLTEDQGWRIEIKKYPLLTEKGSIRRKTNFNHTIHKGFYTQNEIKEIVEYAHSFSIKVMPEFDIPGHCRAAIACYKELACFPRDLPVADHWGVKHDVLCAGKDSTIKFVKDIIDEMCELFPDEYFHIGGDEVPKHRWNLCPHCQKKINELGLNNSDELQIHFMNEIKNYCKSKGKQTFMWSWDLKSQANIDNDLGFTKCGEMETGDRPFIDTSTSAYYIDLPYGYISLKDACEHKTLKGNCLGVEATLWTEYIPNIKKAEKMMFPRLAPICETGWRGECSWEKMQRKINFYYSYLDVLGYDYTPLHSANPNKLNGMIESLWFERRQLAWEGLHNIIDDKKIEKISKKS